MGTQRHSPEYIADRGKSVPPANRRVGPFRSLFPVRYYLNDFEFAVTFEPDSEPSSRTVTGLPITGIRTGGEYGRKPAPEMLSGAPYCPFRADIWQLGTMFKLTFGPPGVCVTSHVFFPLTTKYFSVPSPSFPATRGFVRHYVL
jgi:hypothetical protein